MSILKGRAKLNIVVVVVLAMLLQLAAPVVSSFAFAEEAEMVDVDTPSQGENQEDDGTNEPDKEKSNGDIEEPEGKPAPVEDGEEEVNEEVPAGKGEDETELSPLSIVPYGVADEGEKIPDDEIGMKFVKLSVKTEDGYTDITDSNSAKGIELQSGQKVEVFYHFNMDLKKPYEIDSYFTFQLPQSIIAFDASDLSGTVEKEGEPRFKYETNEEGLVTVTFLDKLEPSEYTLNLDFAASFGKFGGDEDLDIDLEIPVAGSEDITIELTFLPSTSDEKMEKTGAVVSKDGKKYINWTVWVNKAGKELKNATLDDTPEDGHILVEGSINIEKYKVGLNGPSDIPIENHINTIKFPIALEDGKFAYKVTYQT